MIVEQLQNYCDCIEQDKDYTKLINELVNLVSMATCWMRSPCETFLMTERKEVVDLPPCGACPFEFRPYYHPFKKDSFKFELVKTKGMEETVTELTDVMFSEVKGVFRVQLPDCKCVSKECGCPTTYKLVVTYDAGFEELPDCLLPVFCDLLTLVEAKNSCECECETCDVNYDEPDYAKGDIITKELEALLSDMLVKQYYNLLSIISLCDDSWRIWGIVV